MVQNVSVAKMDFILLKGSACNARKKLLAVQNAQLTINNYNAHNVTWSILFLTKKQRFAIALKNISSNNHNVNYVQANLYHAKSAVWMENNVNNARENISY